MHKFRDYTKEGMPLNQPHELNNMNVHKGEKVKQRPTFSLYIVILEVSFDPMYKYLQGGSTNPFDGIDD